MGVFWYVPSPSYYPYFVRANSEGSGETSQMRSLARTFADHIKSDKYITVLNFHELVQILEF